MSAPKKIPTTATPAQMRRYVRNIIDVYTCATGDQLRRGESWYQVAHDLAVAMAGDARTGAGVIASLSANKGWGENTRLAAQAFATGTPSGHVGLALDRAAQIMAGADPAAVLPEGKKTWNFYLNISEPTLDGPVTIDRHAHDAMVGVRFGQNDRGLSNANRYDVCATAYRRAAKRMNTTAARMQAVVWCVWIDRKTEI